MKQSELRTPLARARGLGSAKSGTSHFLWQRITALLLVPLTMWFVSSLMRIAVSPDTDVIAGWLASGFNAAALIIMLMALFYHAALGVQVIIEDYVHYPFIKMAMLFINAFLMFAFAAISVIAVLKLHLIIYPSVVTPPANPQ